MSEQQAAGSPAQRAAAMPMPFRQPLLGRLLLPQRLLLPRRLLLLGRLPLPGRLLLTAGLTVLALSQGGPARADPELARAKNCMACHSPDKKLIGPSYKDVALKYANDRNATAKLAQKVREGSVGVWGQIPMPANPQVSAEEATRLVTWVLGQK